MAKSMISARIPEELEAKLEALAISSNRPKGFLLTEALERYVEREAWQLRKIDEAVRAADESGAFISQEAMERWILSWGTDAELPPPEPDVFKPKKMK
jgi:RHH-type rel operon transcriptional repressor/antitoxin RelB